MSNNPKLRKNGGKGTFFGNLLRGALSIGKTLSPNLIGVIANATGLDDAGAIKNALENEKGISKEELEILSREFDRDIVEMEEVTKRWEADSKSDSWLSKNIRPLVLGYLVLTTSIVMILDSALDGFTVKAHWVTLLSSLLITTIGAYFGLREFGKHSERKNGKL